MLTKSSKSLSRKELLLEYSKLRELYEVQQSELHAKHVQAQRLAKALSEQMNSDRIDTTSAPADDLLALEQRLKQEFQLEKFEMVVKLKKLHAINVSLVERINRMLKSQRDQQDERATDSIQDTDNKLALIDQHTDESDKTPSMAENSLQVVPLVK